MALVVVEHPIAGHNLKEIHQLVETAFPEILRATTNGSP
jgi:hypothetical protein